MCFSAEADFISGVVIGGVGLAALHEVQDRRELPLAALPLTFAAHQATQGFVWLGLNGHVNAATQSLALHVYLLIAWVVLPILGPIAMLLVEPDNVRRRCMTVLAAVGAIVGLWLLGPLVFGSVSAQDAGHTIQYSGAGAHADVVTVFYVIATCGSFLLSSLRRVRIFGVANLAGVGIVAYVNANALTSVWCTWAALVSVLIYAELRTRERPVPAPSRSQSSRLSA